MKWKIAIYCVVFFSAELASRSTENSTKVGRIWIEKVKVDQETENDSATDPFISAKNERE